MTAFFSTDGDGALRPGKLSVGPWTRIHMGGYALCGALARSIERTHLAETFVPCRFTVDLFTPIRAEPIYAQGVLVHSGPRIEIVDAEIIQDSEVKARASAVFVAVGDDPPGNLWRSTDATPAAPDGVDPPAAPPMFKSGNGQWSSDFSAHQNAERKSAWQNFPPLVSGEVMSPFQRAAIMAETTSLVCHWGTQGAGFINIDTTFALSRLPVVTGIGLRADSQSSHDGSRWAPQHCSTDRVASATAR